MAGAGLISTAFVYAWKSNQISEYEKSLRRKSKEELIELLPDAWREFWLAELIVYKFTDDFTKIDITNSVVMDAATKNAWDAAEDAGRAINEDDIDAAIKDPHFAHRVGYFRGDVGGCYPASYYLDRVGVGRGSAVLVAEEFAKIAAWKKGGAAYRLIKNNDRYYFINLLKVLREQTEKLCPSYFREKGKSL